MFLLVQAHPGSTGQRAIKRSLLLLHVSECHWFSDMNISQGCVATLLRCGHVFRYPFANHWLNMVNVIKQMSK